MREIFIDIVNGSDSTIKVTKNDNLTGSYKLIITENKKRLDLTDKNIKFAFVKSDSHIGDIIDDLRVTNAAQGEIDFPITNRITKVDGLYSCGIAIYNSTGYLEHTGTFNLYVRENIFEKVSEELLENSDYKELMSLLDRATNLNAELNPLVTNGTILKSNLENDISQASNLKSDLEININRANGVNSELVKNTATAEEKNTTLNNSLEEAKKYINGLNGSQNIPQIRMDLDTLQNGLKSNQELDYQGTNLKCENTLDGRIKDIVLEGMTYQNLAKITSLASGNSFENGIITLVANGTWSRKVRFDTSLIKANTTYTIIINCISNNINTSENNYAIAFFNRIGLEANEVIKFNANEVGLKTLKIISKSDLTGIEWWIEPAATSVSGEWKGTVLILEGDYNQPNKYMPSYFEGIKSVGEREKNLCEFLESGGIIYAGGQDYPNDQYCRTSYIPVEKGKNYSVSPFTLPNLMKGFGIYYYSKNKEWIKNLNSSTNASYFTASATGYVRLEFKLEEGNHINTEQLSKIKIQVNEGKLLSYIPPNKNKVDIYSHSKNYFNPKDFIQKSVEPFGNGIKIVDKTQITVPFDLKGSWTFSCNRVSENVTNPSGGLIGIKNQNDSFTYVMSYGGAIHLNDGVKEIIIYNYCGGTHYLTDIQLEQGEKSPYEPYLEDKRKFLLPFEGGLKGLPNGAKDLIYNKEDGCYVKQKIGTLKLDETIEWMGEARKGNGWAMQNVNLLNKKSTLNGLSNTLPIVLDYGSDSNVFNCLDLATIPNKIIFKIMDSFSRLNSNSTKAEINTAMKQYFKENPTIVYYELEEPKEYKISDTKISLDTYNALTYVFSNNAISPNIKLKVASNLGSIIQQNAKSINAIYKLIDEVLIPQITTNTADIAILKLK